MGTIWSLVMPLVSSYTSVGQIMDWNPNCDVLGMDFISKCKVADNLHTGYNWQHRLGSQSVCKLGGVQEITQPHYQDYEVRRPYNSLKFVLLKENTTNIIFLLSLLKLTKMEKNTRNVFCVSKAFFMSHRGMVKTLVSFFPAADLPSLSFKMLSPEEKLS